MLGAKYTPLCNIFIPKGEDKVGDSFVTKSIIGVVSHLVSANGPLAGFKARRENDGVEHLDLRIILAVLVPATFDDRLG